MFNPIQAYTSARDGVKAAKLGGNAQEIQAARDALGRAVSQIFDRDPNTDLTVLKARYKGPEAKIESASGTDPLAPRGIRNIDSNCWANAVIQFVLGNPELLEAILGSTDPLMQPLQCYFTDHLDGRPNSQIFRSAIADLKGAPDTASFKQFLTKNRETFDVLASSKETSICQLVRALIKPGQRTDFAAIEAPLENGIIHFLKHTPGVLKTLPQNLQKILEQETVSEREFNRAFAVALHGEKHRHAGTQLDATDAMGILLDRLKMDNRVFTFDGPDICTINTALNEPPMSILVQDDGFSHAQIKEEHDVWIGEKSARYRFVQCAIHIGNKSDAGASSGHFVSLRKIDGIDYHMNDESVFKWDGKGWILLEGDKKKNPANNNALGYTPSEMMRQGTYFHYERQDNEPIATPPIKTVQVLTANDNLRVNDTLAWYIRFSVLIAAIFAFIFPGKKK